MINNLTTYIMVLPFFAVLVALGLTNVWRKPSRLIPQTISGFLTFALVVFPSAVSSIYSFRFRISMVNQLPDIPLREKLVESDLEIYPFMQYFLRNDVLAVYIAVFVVLILAGFVYMFRRSRSVKLSEQLPAE